MFVLINLVISIIATVLDEVFFSTRDSGVYGIFSLFYSLVVFIPGLAVAVRRLHDIGKSGWLLLAAFIPVGGIIWLVVKLCTEGDRGRNEYGEDPKEEDSLQPDFA